VLHGGRMGQWLCFVASTAVLFAGDVGIGMLTIIPFGLHWSLYLFLYLYLYIK
jgi:phosphotransferase system  glucose/maltose/N-acetylglucosamine-specific IIC component